MRPSLSYLFSVRNSSNLSPTYSDRGLYVTSSLQVLFFSGITIFPIFSSHTFAMNWSTVACIVSSASRIFSAILLSTAFTASFVTFSRRAFSTPFTIRSLNSSSMEYASSSIQSSSTSILNFAIRLFLLFLLFCFCRHSLENTKALAPVRRHSA